LFTFFGNEYQLQEYFLQLGAPSKISKIEYFEDVGWAEFVIEKREGVHLEPMTHSTEANRIPSKSEILED
jgi:hypothetical protein